jgi:two-component system, chemotaxis family, protein-glutamate methylesterase/glutaminase
VLEDGTARFRCQTGHAFTSEGLVVAQSEGLERALESAARTHRDRLTLCRRMEEQARTRAQPHSAARWHAAAEEASSAAAAITAAIAALRKPAVR